MAVIPLVLLLIIFVMALGITWSVLRVGPGKTFKWLAIPLVLGVGLLLVGIFTLRVSHQREALTQAEMQRQEAVDSEQEARAMALVEAEPWVPTAVLEKQQQMFANLHPSQDSAISLMTQLAGLDVFQEAGDDQPELLVIDGSASQAWIDRLVQALIALEVPRDRIRVGGHDSSEGVWYLKFEQEQRQGQPPTVALTIQMDGLPKVLEASYLNEDWVEDLATYQSVKPSMPVYVGRSSLVDSPEAATRQSTDHLVAAISQASGPGALVEMRDGKIEVLRRVGGGQEANIYKIDRTFLQAFDRPYGKLWRQAVLIEGSSDASVSSSQVDWDRWSGAQPVASAGHGEAVHGPVEQSQTRYKLFAVVVMVLVIVVLYYLLSAITKGYFRKRIVLVLGVLLLLVMLLLAVLTLSYSQVQIVPNEGVHSAAPGLTH